MSYRFINPAPVLFNLAGTEPAAGGSLTFYDRGTTDPATTWSDEDMATPNTNPVVLDSSGRANTEIWLDGEYTCVLKDSLGATIWTRDLVSEAEAGTTIPALVSGEFLTNDGTNLLWQAILSQLLPDMTGQSGKWLSNDGANGIWSPAPTVDVPDIDSSATSFRIGLEGGSHLLIQVGTDTAPASGAVTTTKAVSFSPAFTTLFIAFPVCETASQPGGPVVPSLQAPATTSGFTAIFDIAEGAVSGATFSNPVPFRWIAIGLLTDPTP